MLEQILKFNCFKTTIFHVTWRGTIYLWPGGGCMPQQEDSRGQRATYS